LRTARRRNGGHACGPAETAARGGGGNRTLAQIDMHCIRLSLLVLVLATRSIPAVGPGGAVATVHPLATAAALETMQQGGNAIDAAIAAGLTLGVVDTHNSGIGGGCFLLIRRADGSLTAIDGRERAPAAATRDMFLRAGKADTRLSQTGALAIGIPGSLAAYDYAVRNYGKHSLRTHLLAAAKI